MRAASDVDHLAVSDVHVPGGSPDFFEARKFAYEAAICRRTRELVPDQRLRTFNGDFVIVRDNRRHIECGWLGSIYFGS